MTRTFKAAGKAINTGDRIPLSFFREPITILRAESSPSSEDASWVRTALRVGNWMSAVEEGLRVVVAAEKQSDKELFLFVVHHDPAHEFTVADYVVWGNELFNVQGYRRIGGQRGYTQINTRPWGTLKEGDFILDPDADVAPVRETVPSRDNLFWDDPV